MSSKNEDKTEIEEMQEKLQKIKEQEGIIGYILRDKETASIDLKDPKKIIDYAVLSSTAFEAANNLADTLSIGEITEIIVESEEAKVVSINAEKYRLSIFMENTIDHTKLCKSLE